MPEFTGSLKPVLRSLNCHNVSRQELKWKKITFQKSTLFIAFMLLMKIFVVHPTGLCPVSAGALRGLAEPWGAGDSGQWCEGLKELMSVNVPNIVATKVLSA